VLLAILGPRVPPGGWNRSLGELHLRSGSKIYVDGADDGALRIQGKNLRGAWCDEVGLWKMWDKAWNESLSFAVRHDPARIVASGTPKMGHGLVRQLVEDPNVVKTRMSTADNVKNLHPSAIKELYERYGNTRLGTQELDGEWISALEGDALKRSWWRYYEKELLKSDRNGRAAIGNGEIRFQWVIVSVDAPQKDKQASDNVAIQVWGADHANRYLLDARAEKLSYDQTKRAIIEVSKWARRNWRCQHRVLIENAGRGPELLVDLKRDLGGIQKVNANVEGNKGQRALAAAGDLETGNVFLPGRMKDDLSGPDERVCPAMTMSLIEEAAVFQLDGSHDSHDDQVDAWSQCMNWLRSRQSPPGRTWSSFKRPGRKS
jgi:predicted phage terminase large subunit-like protein